jgi:DNA-binding transcriptional LysR family regulator
MASLPFTLRQLEYFDTIASEGSLAGAAERCHVSASALALAIDDLEHHLAQQLFVRRKGRGVTLTAAGARLLTTARGVLAHAEALAGEASEAAGSLTGRFAIGCFSTLAPFFLPGIMDGFGRRHPGLALEFSEASAPELDDLLLQGRVDVALLYAVDVSPQLVFDPVHAYRPHVVLAARHALAGGVSARLADLAAEPLILLDMHPARRNTEQIFAALGLAPRVGHVTTSFELARCLAGRGLGYSVLFQKPAPSTTYDGQPVATLPIEEDLPPTVVGLARPAGALPSARYAALLEHVRSTATL